MVTQQAIIHPCKTQQPGETPRGSRATEVGNPGIIVLFPTLPAPPPPTSPHREGTQPLAAEGVLLASAVVAFFTLVANLSPFSL